MQRNKSPRDLRELGKIHIPPQRHETGGKTKNSKESPWLCFDRSTTYTRKKTFNPLIPFLLQTSTVLPLIPMGLPMAT